MEKQYPWHGPLGVLQAVLCTVAALPISLYLNCFEGFACCKARMQSNSSTHQLARAVTVCKVDAMLVYDTGRGVQADMTNNQSCSKCCRTATMCRVLSHPSKVTGRRGGRRSWQEGRQERAEARRSKQATSGEAPSDATNRMQSACDMQILDQGVSVASASSKMNLQHGNREVRCMPEVVKAVL